MNLKDALATVTSYFSPKIIGEVNDQFIKVAKIKGQDLPWHNHAQEDELFYIVAGNLLMEVENEIPLTMNEGDFYVVKKGINHRVSAEEECSIMLIESKTTAHTGTIKTAITKSIEDQKY